MNRDSRLVYSSDPKMNEKCPKCKELKAACSCVPEAAIPSELVAVLRLEKQGRGGKTVTVIDRLPLNEAFLKGLTSSLKKKCGSGGTYRLDGNDGIIEIQGDKREVIRSVLAKQGYRVKG